VKSFSDGLGHDFWVPGAGRGVFGLNLKTAVKEGLKARKSPSHQGKEALWDEF
jgi:hypothetical protein